MRVFGRASMSVCAAADHLRYSGAVTRREKIDAVVQDVLSPLLEKDGSGISVVAFEDSVLTLRLSGAMPGDPGTPYVKRGVIEPAIHAAGGPDVKIVYQVPSFSD